MIHIRKETLRFMRCPSCLTDRDLNNIKIQYPDSDNYQSITLCDNCIQHLVNLFQKDKHSYIADTKENGVIWHDLRKNPDDLPDTDRNVYVQTKGGDTGKAYYHREDSWQSYQVHGIVIAWCEIPKFEVTE